MFSDHNKIKLGINNSDMTGNFPNTWKLNSLLQNNPRMEKTSKKIKYIFNYIYIYIHIFIYIYIYN